MKKYKTITVNDYKSAEARQAIDLIIGICDECFKKGLFNESYPEKKVHEIIKTIADDFEWLVIKKHEKRDDFN